MKKNSNKSIELLKRYLNGQCNAKERIVIENAYCKFTEDKKFKDYTEPDFEGIGIQTWNEIADIINRREIRRSKRKQYFAAAASVALLIAAVYTYQHTQKPMHFTSKPAGAEHSTDNGVMLVLSNGQTISVENMDTGNIVKQQGVALRKAGNSTLVYNAAALPAGNNIVYNMLETSPGKQYSIILQDGTFVRLNASSSLKYPAVFNGKERIVELSGEAYFEVAHDNKMPFKVKLKDEEIEDIGTHFNINAYPDEESTKTTLLEGSVRVSTSSSHTVLQPGQQSICADGKIFKTNADTSLVMAWNNGYFKFKNDNIQSVMRQLARWYNINVYYSKEIPEVTFGAVLSRENSISQVLDLLESTGKVHFRFTGNDVYVTP